MPPGCTHSTLTRLSRISSRIASENARTAALLALYIDWVGTEIIAKTLDRFTIVLPGRACSSGKKIRLPLTTPQKLMSISQCASAGSRLLTGETSPTPALLTSTSTPSKACRARSASASRSAIFATSQTWVRQISPRARRGSATVSRRAKSMSQISSRAPCAAIALASASPMPDAAPVMTTALP